LKNWKVRDSIFIRLIEAFVTLHTKFVSPVDCNGRRVDSCGMKGQWETPQALAPRRPPGRPRKAKRLEWKSTAWFILQTKKEV